VINGKYSQNAIKRTFLLREISAFNQNKKSSTAHLAGQRQFCTHSQLVGQIDVFSDSSLVFFEMEYDCCSRSHFINESQVPGIAKPRNKNRFFY